MRGFDVVDQLARIDCPTLVCVGELDPITPVAAAREIVDALPAGIAPTRGDRGRRPLPVAETRPTYWPLLTEFVSEVGTAARRR